MIKMAKEKEYPRARRTLFSKAVDENISSPQFYQNLSHFVKRKGGKGIG